MSSCLLNLCISDITGIPSWTDKCYIQFFIFADILLSFMSNQNVLHVETFHFLKQSG